jgi:two-component system response regulator (stage 0 sporulation protein A)
MKGKKHMEKQVKVVVVDDNEAVIRSVKEYFRNSEIVSVIGGFTNGKDALNYLLQNPDQYDILMLDLILTHFDGIRIIEELKNHNINKKIMVLSSFKDDFTIRRVQALGASYFMLKPVDMDVVNSRLIDLVMHKEEMKVVKSNKIESEVSVLLHDLGIPTHVRGYQYIREGVMLLYASDGISSLVTKEIYPRIANKYQTTSSRVERAIRHAIEISWSRGDIKLMEDLFGNSIDFDRSRPTNSEFLSTLADKFKLNTKELIA